MDDYYYEDEEDETASQGGGCFPGLLLPPFIVVFVGLLIGFISSGAAINIPANAAANSTMAGQADSNAAVSQTSADIAGSDQLDTNPIIIPGNGGLSAIFTPEIQYWKEEILDWSTKTGLDPNMIATVMQIESCGDPLARSSAGAMGLFQVMPFHFYSEDDPYKPETNALRGMSYLRKALEVSSGDARLAFAGYNGGISVISKSESTWANETQRYSYWGGGIFQEAIQGASVSEVLQEWLSSGGASLCKQADGRLGITP
jgi:soluble lytic murein transglycosylase-like protein